MPPASHRKLGPSPSPSPSPSPFPTSSSPSPSESPTRNYKHHSPPHTSLTQLPRPSMLVIVGVLTAIFSITFLILIYAKHCKRTNYSRNAAPTTATARRKSGIDRFVVESLPLFRFGALEGYKEGLECAVCLGKFDLNELLRILPKCKHIFHVECVDTWLDAHSTCPLCRKQVDPEDILLVPDFIGVSDDGRLKKPEQGQEVDHEEEQDVEANSTGCGFMRVSGRHSSAGEKSSTGNSMPAVAQKPPPRQRKSVDDGTLKSMVAPRKDLLLLTEKESEGVEGRFGYRIIVSRGEGNVGLERWSDMRPSDLLFLRADMIIDGGWRTSCSSSTGRSVAVNPRSQSEITGVSRRESGRRGRRRVAEESTTRRWLTWIGNRRGGTTGGTTNWPNS